MLIYVGGVDLLRNHPLCGGGSSYLFYDFDLRASHARTHLPAALASVPFGFVLVRVRVRVLPYQRD